MNKRNMQVVILTLFGISGALYSNGSPFDTSPVFETGNLEPVEKKEIALDAEEIYITIDGDYLNVRVNYTFTNHGTDEVISYGFPLDFWNYEETEDEDNWLYKRREGALPRFRMADETGDLDIWVQDAENVLRKYSPDAADMDYGELTIFRKWYMADVSFPGGTTKYLTVEYRIRALYDDWITNKDPFPSFNNRLFLYELAPSGRWGNGVVKSYKVEVDASKEIARGTEIIEMKLPGEATVQDGKYTFTAENLDLYDADWLSITYYNGEAKYEEYFKALLARPDQISSYRVSSYGGESYHPRNLFDGDLSTAWVEGVDGNGEGEWIEIELADVPVVGVGIINGYTKSEETYFNNARVAGVKIQMWDEEGKERMNRPGGAWEERGFKEPRWEGGKHFIDYLYLFGEAHYKVSRIRITIDEVVSGTKYEDLCISELYLLVDNIGEFYWEVEDYGY